MYIKVAQESNTITTVAKTQTGDYSQEGQSSALDLVNPHLSSLSKYWLSALKDYACLDLPSQLSTQLPTSGGSFYTQEVADKVKPYYEDSWPSILHAATIWLHLEGFKEQPSSDNLPQMMLPQVDPRNDRFYLTLGLAIKALCTPSILDSLNLIQSCLLALEAILSSQFAQKLLAGDSKLGVEVLSMCHRLLITCNQSRMHKIIMKLVSLVGQAFNNGEGNLESTLEPGNSVAFGIIQAIACCVLHIVPTLASEAIGPVVSQPKSCSEEDIDIASFALAALPTAFKLCNLEASVEVLPSLLYMILSSIKHLTILKQKSTELVTTYDKAISSATGVLAVIIGCVSGKQNSDKLINIMRSSFSTLLSTNDTCLKPDDDEILLILVVTFLKVDAILCAPNTGFFDRSVTLLKDALKSDNNKVRTSSHILMLLFSIVDGDKGYPMLLKSFCSSYKICVCFIYPCPRSQHG